MFLLWTNLPQTTPLPVCFYLGLIFSNVIAWVCFLFFGGVAYFGLSLSLWNCNENLLFLRLGKIQVATSWILHSHKKAFWERVCMEGSGSQPFGPKYNKSKLKKNYFYQFWVLSHTGVECIILILYLGSMVEHHINTKKNVCMLALRHLYRLLLGEMFKK